MSSLRHGMAVRLRRLAERLDPAPREDTGFELALGDPITSLQLRDPTPSLGLAMERAPEEGWEDPGAIRDTEPFYRGGGGGGPGYSWGGGYI